MTLQIKRIKEKGVQRLLVEKCNFIFLIKEWRTIKRDKMRKKSKNLVLKSPNKVTSDRSSAKGRKFHHLKEYFWDKCRRKFREWWKFRQRYFFSVQSQNISDRSFVRGVSFSDQSQNTSERSPVTDGSSINTYKRKSPKIDGSSVTTYFCTPTVTFWAFL